MHETNLQACQQISCNPPGFHLCSFRIATADRGCLASLWRPEQAAYHITRVHKVVAKRALVQSRPSDLYQIFLSTLAAPVSACASRQIPGGVEAQEAPTLLLCVTSQSIQEG